MRSGGPRASRECPGPPNAFLNHTRSQPAGCCQSPAPSPEAIYPTDGGIGVPGLEGWRGVKCSPEIF